MTPSWADLTHWWGLQMEIFWRLSRSARKVTKLKLLWTGWNCANMQHEHSSVHASAQECRLNNPVGLKKTVKLDCFPKARGDNQDAKTPPGSHFHPCLSYCDLSLQLGFKSPATPDEKPSTPSKTGSLRGSCLLHLKHPGEVRTNGPMGLFLLLLNLLCWLCWSDF